MATVHSPATIVLVVEDDHVTRFNTVEMIVDSGWQAIEAANADEALDLWPNNPDISVLFTDVNMPGSCDGVELARRVHLSHPHARIVITSGNAAVPKDHMPAEGTFLPKPYGLEDLRRARVARLA